MSKQTEALKLALEDLLLVWKDRPSITAIREALAEQPAQVDPCIDGSCSCCWTHLDEQPASKPWVPLTEFDIDQIPYSCSHADSRLIAYAIEAKLREKNA